jgi:hypothetical protein
MVVKGMAEPLCLNVAQLLGHTQYWLEDVPIHVL